MSGVTALERGERVIGRVEDMPPGSVTVVDGGPFGIGIFNVQGRFHALSNHCPHRGAPVCRGQVTGVVGGRGAGELTWSRDGEFVACPWHAWEFEIATGRSYAFPDKRIRTYPVRVVDGLVIVRAGR